MNRSLPLPTFFRSRSREVLAAATTILVTALAGCGGGGGESARSAEESGPKAEIGTLPAAAAEIMEQPPYESSRWIYYVGDPESGDALLANRPDEMVLTGSTAKEFVVGSVYDTLGTDRRLTTPVYATTPVSDGQVEGDLVLVASGDLALGGRNALEAEFAHAFVGDTVDHVYGNIAPNADRVGDPLAGLNNLAEQIADEGVERVEGDVRIDTSLWDTFEGQEGPLTPIFVNDNVVDMDVTGVSEGEPAKVEVTPETEYFEVESEVETVGKDFETHLEVVASPDDPGVLVVSGKIAEGETQLAIHSVEDAAAWARALFIEALERADIEVDGAAGGENDESGLPASDSYSKDQELASLKSPPLSALGSMILEVSYNAGANAFLCLLAVDAGSKDCNDGLETMYDLAEEAGLDTDELFLVDGQGADPASTTPRQISRWLQWSMEQPWGEAFVKGQPILGETGSLAPYGRNSPAAGKVAAKAGTSIDVDRVTGRMFSQVQSLSGYLTLEDGKVVVFGLSQSGGTFPEVYEGLVDAGGDVADVAAAFQESLSE